MATPEVIAIGSLMGAVVECDSCGYVHQCHNPPHELPQQRLRHARPRSRVASVYPDEGSRAAAPDPDPLRAGRVARGLLRPAVSGCHQLLVGEPVRSRNARINAAVRAQLEELEQVILAGFTHEPVIAPVGGAECDRPCGTHPLLLRRQWLLGRRGGGENELPLLAQRGP